MCKSTSTSSLVLVYSDESLKGTRRPRLPVLVPCMVSPQLSCACQPPFAEEASLRAPRLSLLVLLVFLIVSSLCGTKFGRMGLAHETMMEIDFPLQAEPPFFLAAAASVFFAIQDAQCSSATRTESGLTGPFKLSCPATCEHIRMACVDRLTKQVRSITLKHLLRISSL